MKVVVFFLPFLVGTLAFAGPKEGESYFIKSIERNQYLFDRGGGLGLGNDDRKATFNIEKKGDNFYLRLSNGQYVSAAKRTEADVDDRGKVNLQPHAQEWEKFIFVKTGTKGVYFIRSRQWNTYLRANIRQNIVDQTDVAQSWEKFEFINAKAASHAEGKPKEVLENEAWAKKLAEGFFRLEKGNNGDLNLSSSFHRYAEETGGFHDAEQYKTWEQLPYKIKMFAGRLVWNLDDEHGVRPNPPMPHPNVTFVEADISSPTNGESYFIKSVETDEDEYVYDRGDGLGLHGTEAQKATFTVEQKGDNFYLRLSNGKYVSAAKRTGDDDANSRGKVNFQPHAQEWEKFTFEKTNKNRVYHIKSSQWKTYLRANIPQDIVDQTDAASRWGEFEFIKAKAATDAKGKHKDVLENEAWAIELAESFYHLEKGSHGEINLSSTFHHYTKEYAGVDTTQYKTWEQLPYKLKMWAGQTVYGLRAEHGDSPNPPIPHPYIKIDD